MTAKMREVAIIGAGPAGISAAIYLKRAGVDPLLLERGRVGGLLLNANLVENYPGFPNGIEGKDLARLFGRQLRRWSIKVTRADVSKVSKDGARFRLLADGREFESRFLIVAAGTVPKRISLKGIDSIPRGRILHEIADAPSDLEGRTFLIVGGSDAAFDYGLNIARRGGFAEIIFRGRKPTCLGLLLARAGRESRVRLFQETRILSVGMRNRRILMKCRSGGSGMELEGDCLLIACGREPDLGFLSPALRSKAAGLLGGDRRLYFVGDIRSGPSRQVGIAVGDGIAAAMDIARQIGKEDPHEDTG